MRIVATIVLGVMAILFTISIAMASDASKFENLVAKSVADFPEDINTNPPRFNPKGTCVILGGQNHLEAGVLVRFQGKIRCGVPLFDANNRFVDIVILDTYLTLPK